MALIPSTGRSSSWMEEQISSSLCPEFLSSQAQHYPPSPLQTHLAEGIIQGVEEEGRGGGEQVMDVLLQHVDVFAGGLLAHEAVIVDGVNVALLGHHEPEAAAGGVAEGDGLFVREYGKNGRCRRELG
eukprot:1155364-Pelagomonas_calceolata.AAC.5